MSEVECALIHAEMLRLEERVRATCRELRDLNVQMARIGGKMLQVRIGVDGPVDRLDGTILRLEAIDRRLEMMDPH